MFSQYKIIKNSFAEIGQPGGFLGRLLGPLLKNGLSLIGNVIKSLAKSVLIPLGLTATVSATDTTIHKRIFGSRFTKRILFNKEMKDIKKIVKPLEGSGLLIKGANETSKNESKKQKGEFLGRLLGIQEVSLLGNLLTGKGAIATSHEQGRIRAGEDTIRAGESF